MLPHLLTADSPYLLLVWLVENHIEPSPFFNIQNLTIELSPSIYKVALSYLQMESKVSSRADAGVNA